MRSLYFYNVHLLRAAAALSVVVYHVIELLPWKAFPITPEPLLWFRIGWVGVDLFFVISGFVISLSAIRLLREGERPFARTYARHRVARILPLYYFTGLVFILFVTPQLLANPALPYHLFTHLFFVHNIDPVTQGSINGANWSVGTEMQFYLLILLTARLLSRVNPWIILLGGVTVSWSWRMLVFQLVTENQGGTFEMFVYTTQLFGMLDEFAFGIFLSRLVLDHIDHAGDASAPLQRRLLANGWLWFAGFLIVGWITWRVYWSTALYWSNWNMVVFWRTGAAMTFFFLIGSAVFLRVPDLIRRFVLPPFLYLGEISYGIYLWHLPVIVALQKSGITNPIHFLSLTLLFVILMASITWHFIERPLLRRYR